MRPIVIMALIASLVENSFTSVITSHAADNCATLTGLSEHRFYVDPIRGNKNNDGSMLRPWRTLAEVVDQRSGLISTRAYSGDYRKGDRALIDINPLGPIKGGDTIVLMNGDHGDVKVIGAINQRFINVVAAPGQIPVLRSLSVDGAEKWAFNGLKVQGASDDPSTSPKSALVDFGHNLWKGPARDIIFANGSVSTAENTRNWTDDDWVRKPFMVGLRFDASCVTVRKNHFFNLRNAVGVEGSNSLVTENKINDFGNDGIDISVGNVTISNNYISSGRHTPHEPGHADGIQGWTKGGAVNRNVTIEGNTILNFGKNNNLQGISIFDGKWDGLRIFNNVVVTNHWHGVAVYGAINTSIINNTVISSEPAKYSTWISVQNAKDGTPSRDVIVRNNITTQLTYTTNGTSADRNIIADRITLKAAGKISIFAKPGTYEDNNTISPDIYSTFESVDHQHGVYDLRLKPGSPAIGSGNPKSAPKHDILKRVRKSWDIGAYSY